MPSLGRCLVPLPWTCIEVVLTEGGRVAKYLELRRHTDDDDDALSEAGVRRALEIGAGLHGRYDLLVSTGAQRATQTLGCFLAALGEKVPGGVVV